MGIGLMANWSFAIATNVVDHSPQEAAKSALIYLRNQPVLRNYVGFVSGEAFIKRFSAGEDICGVNPIRFERAQVLEVEGTYCGTQLVVLLGSSAYANQGPKVALRQTQTLTLFPEPVADSFSD